MAEEIDERVREQMREREAALREMEERAREVVGLGKEKMMREGAAEV